MEQKKVKVLIVDDSALIRSLLSAVINEDPRLEVVATANDPFDAREKIKHWMPDVITLDIEMPKMNGIAFLKNLMRLRPMPVVMISTLTQAGAPATLEALALGAVDYVAKPHSDDPQALAHYGQSVCEKIYWASQANIANLVSTDFTALKMPPKAARGTLKAGFLCAIGASTGGTEAIKAIVSQLPDDAPPIVIAQHIPAAFSQSFARRMNACSAMTVHEAEHQQPIERGHAYLAPGSAHLLVKRIGAGYWCHLDTGPEVNRHKPSVEPLFDSASEAAGKRLMALILTGMGADGAAAMRRVKERGAYTVVQDEQSSVVWGMPGAAFKLGAACEVLALEKMSLAIMRQSRR
ncbi:protein-glutamate methylesterase/protein-glutamine glutaminase [Marinagarivorans algicola]|uniref:protein-glutamate methylesterase/protein-glutamine glutaminase n=1 Tax=Marinagarivorans algicola TaxID=1513270 RepID=UPI0006B62234|nr:chemotaxis response regulator protein-glutamate methylesterase [Marinagarivorans algicola]